jgi:ABC-type branched-subunit amino acid transport system ATPase component
VIFEGRDLDGFPPWEVSTRGLGKVFQDVRVFPSLSVLDNVVAAMQRRPDLGVFSSLRWADKRLSEVRDRAGVLLDEVGIEGDREGPARDLSWGNQKLLALARVMVGDFRLLLPDEPVAGVSTVMVARILELVRRLVAERGMTVGVIEHDAHFVAKLADYTVVLREGAVFDQGPTAEVLERPANIELCLGL